MKLSEDRIAFFIGRLRWETAAGLSAFKNLSPPLAFEYAQMRLEAIDAVLSQIDRENEAVPIN